MSYKKLHEHILQEHDLYLLGDDMQEIIRIVLEINDNKLDVIDDYPLFEHIDRYYGVTLLESQLGEIVRIVLEMHNEKPETCKDSIEKQYKEKGNQLGEVYGAIKEPSNKSAVGSAKIADSVADSRKIEKMKTAMQQHIEQLKEKRSAIYESFNPLGHLKYINYLRFMITQQLNENIEMAESMLKEEREHIIKAYMEGCSDSIFDGRFDEIRAEQYYTETYRKL